MRRRILTEGRREELLSRFNENPELQNTVEEFLDDDFNIKTNYKYVNWVLKRDFDQMGNLIIDFESMVTYLEKFDRIRKNLSKKDINEYKNIQDLIDTIEVYGETKGEKKLNVKSGTEKIYEDNEVLVVKPLTAESSCYYGTGTRWCTSAKESDNRFNNYNSRGPLYYYIFKNLDIDNDFYKIAIHYESREDVFTLYDAKDKVNSNLLGFIKDKPAFKSIEEDVSKNHTYVQIGLTEKFTESFYRIAELGDKWKLLKRNKRVINGKPLIYKSLNSTFIVAKYNGLKVVLFIDGIYREHLTFKVNSNSQTEVILVDTEKIEVLLENDKIIYGNLNLDNVRGLLGENDFMVVINRIMDYFINRNVNKLTEEGISDITYWQANNINSTYQFANINTDNAYIKFLEYIRGQESKNDPATKKDFLLNVLSKDPEDVNFSGYLSTMFSSMKDAGLVSLYRAKTLPYFRYKIGPNYDIWKHGRLNRL